MTRRKRSSDVIPCHVMDDHYIKHTSDFEYVLAKVIDATAAETIELCAKCCEELAKLKSKVAADALRQAAKQMRGKRHERKNERTSSSTRPCRPRHAMRR